MKEVCTSVARVEVKVELSNTHPLWHPTVGRSALLEPLAKSWNWGSANISQDLGFPSPRTGTLTVSLCSQVKFLKSPPSSSLLISQWWGGKPAMKLFSRKWHGRTIRGMNSRMMMLIWKGPKPLISSRIFSNFMVTVFRDPKRTDLL